MIAILRSARLTPYVFFLAYLLVLSIFYFWPEVDLWISNLFFDPALQKFPMRKADLPVALHESVQWGGRGLAIALGIIACICLYKKRAFMGLTFKPTLFLLVALIIGPGIITNTILKDNWARARPIQVHQFGGQDDFTPPLVISDECARNCSFVSGDGALGFFMHSFFYVVPARFRRRVFWTGIVAGGGIFGGVRVLMGAHFMSDVLFAGFFMVLTSAAIHAAFYGIKSTKEKWRDVIKPAN